MYQRSGQDPSREAGPSNAGGPSLDPKPAADRNTAPAQVMSLDRPECLVMISGDMIKQALGLSLAHLQVGILPQRLHI